MHLLVLELEALVPPNAGTMGFPEARDVKAG
jgi:hypothetical protein